MLSHLRGAESDVQILLPFLVILQALLASESIVPSIHDRFPHASQGVEDLLMRGDEGRTHHTTEKTPEELKLYLNEESPTLEVRSFVALPVAMSACD